MRRHVRTLHMIFDGFDRELWGNNDGAVNLHSMLQPWASKVSSESDTESTASTSSSLSLEADLTTASTTQKASVDLHRDEINPSDPTTDPLDLSELRRGTWYVHRVEKNHMAGTHFDSDSPELFQRLFRVLADQFETRESLDFLEKKKRGQAEACLRAQNLFL
ncbi:hypothetical protein PC118_g13731 [Phytophthora cactorum]|nr:hypothetical protein PC111_g12546 [Phytophthora cactorum]KAG2852955.1 hypothetical protein PC113_g14590 [Phytophthora cactorum]KAG2925820.1 hypothetical protein PC117_g15070 [Phytophthora cactorum]KAG2975799.1 hypothetical protein PC118_g13731 [Phytophthora cactorum]KAG3005171.1 hypothetical protein PC119_g15365 [Phytophthora cactorum]